MPAPSECEACGQVPPDLLVSNVSNGDAHWWCIPCTHLVLTGVLDAVADDAVPVTAAADEPAGAGEVVTDTPPTPAPGPEPKRGNGKSAAKSADTSTKQEAAPATADG